MTDLMSRLTDARPTTTELDALWSPADRAARLDEVLATRSPRRAARWRRTTVLAAAAAVALAVVVSPVLDSGDATAADLHALAASAVRYDGPVLQPGTWLHETSVSTQRNSRVLSDGAVLDEERETWQAWDGTLWLVEHRPSAGWTSYDVLDERATPSIADPTPAFAATLPDDADGLLAYLDGRVSGSSSHDEAMFEALTQLATSHTLPARTLAATFEALARLDGVDTEHRVVDGRPSVEVSFTEHHLDVLGVSSIVADEATGQVLATTQRSPFGSYRSTTTLSEVVDAMPADVLAAFDRHGDGGTTCAPDRPDCLPR